MAANSIPKPKKLAKPLQVNLYEAKTQLSSLVERAAKGEEIVIAKAGKPMARLVPPSTASQSPRTRAFLPCLWLGAFYLRSFCRCCSKGCTWTRLEPVLMQGTTRNLP